MDCHSMDYHNRPSPHNLRNMDSILDKHKVNSSRNGCNNVNSNGPNPYETLRRNAIGKTSKSADDNVDNSENNTVNKIRPSHSNY